MSKKKENLSLSDGLQQQMKPFWIALLKKNIFGLLWIEEEGQGAEFQTLLQCGACRLRHLNSIAFFFV